MNASQLPSAPAIYLKVAESAWATYVGELADQPAHPWWLRVRGETYSDACAMGFSGSLDQWGKEMRKAGDRLQRRRVAQG